VTGKSSEASGPIFVEGAGGTCTRN